MESFPAFQQGSTDMGKVWDVPVSLAEMVFSDTPEIQTPISNQFRLFNLNNRKLWSLNFVYEEGKNN